MEEARADPHILEAGEVETRRAALEDQIKGIEWWIDGGRDEPHLVDRLAHTQAEIRSLRPRPAGQHGDT